MAVVAGAWGRRQGRRRQRQGELSLLLLLVAYLLRLPRHFPLLLRWVDRCCLPR